MDKFQRRCILKDNRDLNYEEFLNQTQKEPNEKKLRDMEKVLCKATILKCYQKPLNNFDYKPFIGGA